MPQQRRLPLIHFAVLFAALVLFGAGRALAQGKSQVMTISGPDGWPIRFTYYPAPEKMAGNDMVDVKNAPVVILLHGANGSRLFWDKTSAWPGGKPGPFAEALQSTGFAVLSVDLRKHGESVREGDSKLSSADYELMVGDLAKLKEFLFEQNQAQKLNMRKCAIVAMDDACPVAAAFADLDWKLPPHDDHAIPAERTPRGGDIKALVMISPSASAGHLRAVNAMRFLGNPELGMSFLFIVGKKDSEGLKTARTLQRIVGGRANEARVKIEELETNEKSEHLFGNPRLRTEAPLLDFLKKNVQDLNIPWQDRRSRRDR